MRHGQGTKHNTDVHNALDVIKKYNVNQEIDEAPYSLGQRTKDTAKSWVPGGMRRMAKGRKDSGNIANDVNKQWQSHLGKAGHMNQDAVTVKELSDFIERTYPGTDPLAFYKKAGIVATDDTTIIPKKSQEKIILSLAQSINSGSGGSTTTDTTGTTGTTGTTTGTPDASGGGGGLGAKAAAATDFAKRATSSKSDKEIPAGSPKAPGEPGEPSEPSMPAKPRPDSKEAEIIDFVSNLKDAQKKELRGYIRNAMSSRAQKVGH